MPVDFNITARLNLQGPSNLGAVVGEIRSQLRNVNGSVGLNTGAATAGLQKVTSGAQASTLALRQMRTQAASTAATLSATVTVTSAGAASLRNFGEQAGLAARRFAAFTLAAGSMVNVVRGIQEGVRAAVEFQLAMNKVEQVSDETAARVAGLRAEIGSLATGLGVSSAALAETAITLKQAGLSIDQTKDALKALALTDLAPTFDSMKQSTEGLIASFRQFNLSSTQFETTLSAMNAVAGKFAVESSDIITAVQKAGGAFKLSAGDMKTGSEALNEFMALFTSVRATTRESADAIATGLRTVFTRFQRADTVKALGDLGINLRYTREEARALGNVNLTDQFVGAYEAVRRLSQGLESLRETDPRYAQVVEQLGGYRQISRVVPLLKEFKTAEEAKNIAVAGGISLQVAAEKRQETLSNRITKLKEEYLELFRRLTENKSFQALANSMLTVASAFGRVLDFARPLLPLLTAMAAVKIGANLGGIASSFARAFVAPPGALVSGGRTVGSAPRFAAGGRVPGEGATDTISAVLTPGEFVVRKRSAERLGYQTLHQLNERPERFAAGGRVPEGDRTKGRLDSTTEYRAPGPRFAPLPAPTPRKAMGRRADDTLVQAVEMATRRRLRGYASGGYVPGAGNNDSEHALLMPGEFVLNKQAVAKMGVPSLRDLNEGRSRFHLKRYETGSRQPVGGTRTVDELREQVRQQRAVYDAQVAQVQPIADQLNKGGGGADLEQQFDALIPSVKAAKAQLDAFVEALAQANGSKFGVFAADQTKPGEAPTLLSSHGTLEDAAATHRGLATSKREYAAEAAVSTGRPIRDEYGQDAFAPDLRAGSKRLYVAPVPVAPPADAPPAQPPAPPAPTGRGQSLLARLRAKQPPAPRPTDDIPALSFAGDNPNERTRAVAARPKATERDVPFVSVAADVYRDSEDPAETAREKAARAFFDKQNASPAAEAPSFVSQLKTQQQQEFFAKYAVGKNGGPSVAGAAAEYQAQAFGDRGRAGVASGSVENAAYEAVAQLAVAPPEGFDPNHKDAKGFVVRHVQNAVRTQLGKEYGNKGQRFGGYAPTDAQGNLVEVEGREQDPAQPVDVSAAQAAAKAREQEKAEQLQKVKAVLPANALSANRDDRLTALRTLGASYKDASFGAAESRYTEALAGRVRGALGVPPPGEPPTPPVASGGPDEPGDDKFDALAADARKKLEAAKTGKVRGGIRQVSFKDLPQLGKDLGLDPAAFSGLVGDVKAATDAAGKTGHFEAGLSNVALNLQNGGATVAGVVNNAEVFNPRAAQINKFVRDGERALSPAQPAAKPSTLTNEERDYQTRQLAEAQKKFGSTFGVPGDELASNRRLGRGQATGDAQAFEFEQQRRAESGAFVDPLVVASRTRKERLEAQKQRQAEVRERAAAEQREAQGGGALVGADLRGGSGFLSGTSVDPRGAGLAGGRVIKARPQQSVAEFGVGPDGAPVVTGGLLKDRVDQKTAARIAARGGEENLSDATKVEIRQRAGAEEDTNVRRELLSAQKNLLAQLNPEMSAHERNKKALEDVEKAMKGLAKVTTDHSGKVLGLSSTVDAAAKQGVVAPGAGGVGYRVSSAIGGRLAAAREFATNNKVTRLNERLAGFTQGPGFTLAAAGVGIGTGLISENLNQRAGTADDASKSAAATSDYRANRGAAGALSGAAVGAAVGTVGGPIGIAVGAVVGGAAGLVTALADAAKDIRQAKINNALTELGDKLSAFATGIPSVENLAGIGRNLDDYDRGSDARARDNATSFFSFKKLEFDSFDSGQYAEERQANLRKEFGPLIPAVTQGLAKQAERFGRENPTSNLDDKDVRARVLNDFRGIGGGVNGQLINRIAQAEKTPVKEVEDRVVKALVEAQRQRRVEDENKAAKAATEQQANTFGRLLQSVQAAADSLFGLQQRASGLTDVLDGNLSATRVSARAEALDDGLGRLDGGALKPLDIVAAATGSYGASLRESGAGTDAVARALPGVLASVAGNKDLGDGNISSLVSEGIYRNLGYKKSQDAPESVQKTVAAILGGLNEAQAGGRGVGGVTDEIRTDATKFSDKLLSGAADPVKEFGGKVARQLEENGNRLVDGLTAINQRLQNVGQLYDQLGVLRVQNFRQNLQFAAEAEGRGNQALDFASVRELESGADQRQQRLAGVGGPQAFDPRFLGQQLAQVRQQIGAATERQQEVFEKTGGKGGEFGAAAEQVLRLKDRAANLQQALKNLSDVAERNAVIQEKLNRLKQEEDGRLGLAERFATADATEQLKMDRGFTLAEQASRAGSLDGFGAEDRRAIIDALKSAGGVTLSGFKGAPRADDLLRSLLTNSFGGAFQLTEAQKREKGELQNVATDRGRTAEDAVSELIAHQEAGSAELYRNLQQQQTQFFSKLERLLLGLKRTDVENARARVEADKGSLESKRESRDALVGVGVTTTAQLDALRGKRGDINELRVAIANEKVEQEKIAAAKKRVGEFAVEAGGAGANLPNFLSKAGFAGDQAARIDARTRELLESDQFKELRAGVKGRTTFGSDERKRGLDEVNQKALSQALLEEGARDTGAPVRAVRDRLGGIAGVNPDKVVETLRGPQADAFVKGLDAFDGTANKVEEFGAKLAAITADLAKFDEQLKAITAASATPAGPVATRAGGGTIFRPQGTDTVPAMLTPGEYVVNARSASANAALLHRINEARGPAYLAGGGRVLDDLLGGQAQAAAANREFAEALGDAAPVDLARRRAALLAQNEADVNQLRGIKPRVARVGPDTEPARLSDRYDVFAASAFGRTAQNEAQRLAFDRVKKQQELRGGRRDAAAELLERGRATDTVAGDLMFAAQARNFNRQAGLFSGARRPGDEGQRNVANRVAGVEDRLFEERWKTDDALKRYAAERIDRQAVTVARGRAQRFADGGVVAGAGTGDTVPSLLTPGEFVLNTRAVARLGAHNVQRFNQGGLVGNVSYLAGGGQVQAQAGSSVGQVSFSGEAQKAMADLSSSLAQFVQQAGGFGQAAQQLAQTFNVFVGGAQQLTQALNNMPRNLTIQGTHQVNVVINGAEVMTKLTPEIQQMVTAGVKEQLGRVFKDHLPEVWVSNS